MNVYGSEPGALPDGVQRVAAALQEKGTRTGPARRHLPAPHRKGRRPGIAVGQIAKSIIFRARATTRCAGGYLRATGGWTKRRVEAHVGKVGRADADL